jgi:MFS family permease
MGMGLLVLVLPLYLTTMGLSAAQWGLLSGAFAAGLLLAEPTWGWVSDRLGVVKPFLISRLLSAVLVLAFLVTSELWILLIVQVARGLAEVAMGPLGRKALLHTLGAERKAMGIGLFQACMAVGGGLGPLLGGTIIEHWSFGASFVACSVLSLLGLLITLASRSTLTTIGDPAPRSVGVEKKDSEGTHPAPDHRPYGAFAFLALIAVCLFVGAGVGRSFLPVLGTSIIGLQASQVSLLLTAGGLGRGVLMVVSGRLSDRWGRRPLILCGLVLVGSSLSVFGYAVGFWDLAVLTVLHSFGVAAATPAAVAMVSDVTPAGRQGTMIGLYGAFEDLGLMLGPILCGFLWDSQGARLALAVCGLVTGLGVVPSLFVRRQLRE